MIHTNIDRNSAQYVTKAPFTYESSLMLGPSAVSTHAFVSIKVQVNGNVRVPLHIDHITKDMKLVFQDSAGTDYCYCQFFMTTSNENQIVSTFLYTMTGILVGHLVCHVSVVDTILGLMNKASDTVYLDDSAFILLPQCHNAALIGHGRSIVLDGQPCTKAVNIAGSIDEGTRITVTGSTAQLHAINKQSELVLVPNGICALDVSGTTVWVGGCHVQFRSAVRSNLRVVHEQGELFFKGVQDV